MWYTDTSAVIYDTSVNITLSYTGTIKVECWGAGGGGGGQNLTSDGGGGGGGGAYSRLNSLFVTNGSTFAIQIGKGGTGGTGGAGLVGGTTYFKYNAVNLCYAVGGDPGTNSTGTPPNGPSGGKDVSCLGDVKFSGGWGSAGRNQSNGIGGGGGSSAVSDASGNSVVEIAAADYVQTGYTAPSAEGGNGGDGGAVNTNGSPGTAPGGGGGGSGEGSPATGGDGANGRVKITYLTDIWVPDIIMV